MAFRIVYKPLFQVDIFHSYFLDDGADAYAAMNDDDKKNQLSKYDLSSFLKVIPTYGTRKKLKNHKLIFTQNRNGFTVLASVTEENAKYRCVLFLEEALRLTFLLYSEDYLFDNYTNLPHEPNRLYYFSNVKPTTEANPFDYIPLSSSNDLITEDFMLTEESSQLLWFGLEKEDRSAKPESQFDLVDDIDVSDLSTDEGKKIINQAVQKEKRKGLIGVMQLDMLGENLIQLVEFDYLDPADPKNYLLDPTPGFKIHFDNRKTIWRYIHKKDKNELETLSVKPLTRNGFIEIDPDNDFQAPLPSGIDKYVFPNPTADIITQTTDENTQITTTYSEIYI